jgi:hypothetical protein
MSRPLELAVAAFRTELRAVHGERRTSTCGPMKKITGAVGLALLALFMLAGFLNSDIAHTRREHLRHTG